MNLVGDIAKKASPGVAEESKPANTLLGVLAALTAVLAAAGIAEGSLPRFIAEKTHWFWWAVGFVLLAGAIGVIANLFSFKADAAGKKKGETLWLVVSNLFLFAGLGIAVVGAGLMWSDTRKPIVKGTLEQTDAGTFVNVEVASSGLASNESLTLLVEPLNPDKESDGFSPGTPIYSASLGSDEEGKVKHETRVRLLPTLGDRVGIRAFTGDLPKGCYQRPTSADGCISLGPLKTAESPQIDADWQPGFKSLKVTVHAHDIYAKTLKFGAYGRKSGSKPTQRELVRWSMAPDANGNFKRSVLIPGTSAFSKICVVASTSGRMNCFKGSPPAGSAWARYRVPST